MLILKSIALLLLVIPTCYAQFDNINFKQISEHISMIRLDMADDWNSDVRVIMTDKSIIRIDTNPYTAVVKRQNNQEKDDPKRILIVCTGNTCRSPMAEAYMQSVAPDTWIINSAGTKAENGGVATPLAIEVARNHGLNLSKHSSQLITLEMIEKADIILVMERRHLGLLPPSVLGKARMLDPDSDIVDPYGGDERAYKIAFSHIMKAIGTFLKEQNSP